MSEAILFAAACMLAAFCSGSETAFSAASRIKVAARGRKGERALWFMKEPSRYLVTTLVGTNVGVVTASNVGHAWGGELGGVWSFLFALFTALFFLVFSEIVPKQLALFRSNTFAVVSAPVLRGIRMVLYPLITAASFMSRLVSGKSEKGRFFESREEIKGLLASSGGRKGRTASAVISLGNTGVGDYARSLDGYPSAHASTTREEAIETLNLAGEDFLLVWEEPGTTLLGTVRASELVRWNGKGSITSRATGLPYFNPDYSALKILPRLWRSGATAAVILDSNGQPSQLITPDVILAHLIPRETDG